jgi:molybdate/tungstate transport system substrate-binding protein
MINRSAIEELLIPVIILIFTTACRNTENDPDSLIIFHAGSLSKPFKEMAEAFENENPGTQVLLEAAGSRECARKITELKKPCDIMASSDYTVIEDLLMPDYAGWYINFAKNEMCIAFTDDSRGNKRIDKRNWYELLLADSVSFGRSDPNLDPCGYRTIMLFQLAEIHFNQPRLTDKLLNKDQKHIRPKEVELLSLLETNTIDYIFIYRSVAAQHHLKYIALPDSINLSNPEMSHFYANARIEISGKTPGNTITKKGEPMIYAFTIPKNAPNPQLARKFASFILNPEKGMKIMELNGQPNAVHIKEEFIDIIPEMIKPQIKLHKQ